MTEYLGRNTASLTKLMGFPREIFSQYTAGEPFDIFGRGLLQVTPRSTLIALHDPGSVTLTQGCQEKSMH